MRRFDVARRVDGEVESPTLTNARLGRQMEHMRRVTQQEVEVCILQPAFDESEAVVRPRRFEIGLFQFAGVVISEAVDADHTGAIGE